MESERSMSRTWLSGRISEEHRATLLSWLPWLGLILPMAALLILALRQLGLPSLWRDEVSSVVFAKGSLGQLLTIVGRDRDEVGLANMATYYLMLHFWLAVGETEARIRLLSVLFGVASVVPVYFIARRLGGWLAAGLAAGIFALIPYVIHYSQEARGYSLAMLIGGGLTWLVLIGVERGRAAWWPWLAYGLIAALGLYVHFFLALVVAAHGLWLLLTRQVPGWRGIAAGGLPLLFAAAPIPLIIAQFGGEHGWIPPLNLPRFYAAMVELTGSMWLLIGLTALLVVAAVLRRGDARIWLLVASVLLPVVVVVAVSLYKPFFIPRYLIMVLPMLAVLAGVALVSVRPAVLRWGLVLAVGAVLVLALPSAYWTQTNINWRGAGRFMADEAQPGDRVWMQSWVDSPLEYYLLRASPTTALQKVSYDEALFDNNGRLWLAITGKRQGEIREMVLQFLDRYQVVDVHPLGARGRLFLLEPIDGPLSAVSSPIGGL
jgi:mannosyltransferase